MSLIKHKIITVLLLIAFGLSATAQNSVLSPYEGATHSYGWKGLQGGTGYEFYITSNADGSGIYDDALTGEFDFLTSSSGMVGIGESNVAVDVTWNVGASLTNYYLWLKVTTHEGCSNFRYVSVSPQPNNRSIGFGLTASTECFSLSGNDFTVFFITLDNNGQPVSAAYFPLSVEFSVNGAIQSQLVSYDNQVLQISETMFSALPDQNTSVEVVLTSVTDSKNAPVQPGENGTHLRNIFAIPEIEFTDAMRKKYHLKQNEITAYTVTRKNK